MVTVAADERDDASERIEQRWAEWQTRHNRAAVIIGLLLAVIANPIAILIERAEAPAALGDEFTWIRAIYLAGCLLLAPFLIPKGRASRRMLITASFGGFAAMQMMTTWVSVRWTGLSSPLFADFALTMLFVTMLFSWPTRLVLVGFPAITLAYVIPHVVVSTPAELAAGQYPLFFVITNTVFALVAHTFLYRTARQKIAAQAESEMLREHAEEHADELWRMSRELDRLAHLDGLTQVSNRRALDGALAELDVDDRFALLLIDVDQFKAFNDAAGHQAGDRCLKRVAGELQASVRGPDDLVARYGGEEFAVVLRGADLERASEIAERLRVRVHGLGIPHPASDVDAVVTISVGVAARNGHEELASLVGRADEAVYAAKRRGRNCVVVAE